MPDHRGKLPVDSDWVRDPRHAGPLCIAGGLGLVLAHLSWPALPVLSGIALIALGSTNATLRFGDRCRCRPIVAAHLIVYANLYLVFLGSMCHASTVGPRVGLNWWQAADVLLSIAPMAVAARLGIAALAGGEDASSR
jgi:hypothetical protein